MEYLELKALDVSVKSALRISQELRLSKKNKRYYVSASGVKMISENTAHYEVIEGLKTIQGKFIIQTGKTILYYV